VVDHLSQAAVLKTDPLVGQHTVSASFELAAYRDIRCIGAVIVDAGVSLGVDADAEIGVPRCRDEDAQVGGHEHIRVLAYRVVRLDRTVVQRHHEGAACRVFHRAIFGQVNAAGGTEAESSAALQGDFDCLASRGDFAAIAEERFSVGDVDRAGHLNFRGGGSADGLLSKQGRLAAGYSYGESSDQ
jgi:hypothetical protein